MKNDLPNFWAFYDAAMTGRKSRATEKKRDSGRRDGQGGTVIGKKTGTKTKIQAEKL